MLLALAGGFALRHFLRWDEAVPVALLAGILIALFVPKRGTRCG